MKKNKMMRLASVMLMAVLLTTSVIGGTFAKYTTSDEAKDTARVAKWGVELQVVGNLYGDTYKDLIVKEDDATMTVQSVDRTDSTAKEFADVVAPGTENNQGFTFSLQGQPEVDGEVTTTMKIQNVFLKQGSYGVMIPVDEGVVNAGNFNEINSKENPLYYYNATQEKYMVAEKYQSWQGKYYTLEDTAKVIANDYYPVVYELKGNTETKFNSTTHDTMKKAADKIAEALGLEAADPAEDTSITYTGTKKFETNEDLAEWKVDGLTLTWKWAFDGVNDGADTILGLLENTTEGTVVKLSGEDYVAVEEYVDYCLDTQFDIKITAEQLN